MPIMHVITWDANSVLYVAMYFSTYPLERQKKFSVPEREVGDGGVHLPAG